MILPTEAQFRQQIIELAHWGRWKAYCVFEQASYARRSSKGFPDLVLARRNQDGRTRVLIVELKSEKGKMSLEQLEWQVLFTACPGVEYFLWKPSDFEEIEIILQREMG